jgi:hypothetical protein
VVLVFTNSRHIDNINSRLIKLIIFKTVALILKPGKPIARLSLCFIHFGYSITAKPVYASALKN